MGPALINSVIPGITYSQSSTYSSNTAATFAGMTNGVFAEDTETGTEDGEEEWIKMDLGSTRTISRIVVGCDFNEVLLGGWDLSYTEDKDVQGSTDGTTWTTLFNTGTFTQGIQGYDVSTAVRYVQIISTGYLAVTEFYAMEETTAPPVLWHYVAPPEAEDFCGPHHDVTVTLESVSS